MREGLTNQMRAQSHSRVNHERDSSNMDWQTCLFPEYLQAQDGYSVKNTMKQELYWGKLESYDSSPLAVFILCYVGT